MPRKKVEWDNDELPQGGPVGGPDAEALQERTTVRKRKGQPDHVTGDTFQDAYMRAMMEAWNSGEGGVFTLGPTGTPGPRRQTEPTPSAEKPKKTSKPRTRRSRPGKPKGK